ncbi:hypothetical protein TcG_09883 [Trypanosoma cruzi]|nr:hypothetical protein TcG_09883 [Trypanosoma cruzi]
MRAAERHLHLCVCRACSCREEVQATSHHWAAEAVFPLYSAGEATLSAREVLVCIGAPNGVSRRRVVAVQLSCSSLHTWPCRVAYLQRHGLRYPIERLFTCFFFF